MAVPEASRDRRRGGVKEGGPSRKSHARATAHGQDFSAVDQDDVVADGFLCGAGIDGPADQRELRTSVGRLADGATNFILSAARQYSMLARSNAVTDIPVFSAHRM
jgi:hypothetical protein